MDFVPNHTSDEHIWFNKSVYKETGFENYYVWRDTPNNWVCIVIYAPIIPVI